MSQKANRVALRISAACLCAVLALVVARAHFAGESQDAAPATASQCGGGSSPEAMEAALADAKEQARQERAASGQPDDSGWVVLNNRGYNYGPGPDVRVDLRLFQHEQHVDTQD